MGDLGLVREALRERELPLTRLADLAAERAGHRERWRAAREVIAR